MLLLPPSDTLSVPELVIMTEFPIATLPVPEDILESVPRVIFDVPDAVAPSPMAMFELPTVVDELPPMKLRSPSTL